MKRQALPFFSAYHVRINTDFFNTIRTKRPFTVLPRTTAFSVSQVKAVASISKRSPGIARRVTPNSVIGGAT